jgi:plasmid stability protein
MTLLSHDSAPHVRRIFPADKTRLRLARRYLGDGRNSLLLAYLVPQCYPLAIMAQIIVRNLDEAVVHALKRRAKTAGRSLEAEAREILSAAVRDTRRKSVAFARGMQLRNPAAAGFDVVAAIREGRR